MILIDNVTILTYDDVFIVIEFKRLGFDCEFFPEGLCLGDDVLDIAWLIFHSADMIIPLK